MGTHLRGAWSGPLARSGRFTGGERAARRALAGLDVRGYALARNEVWPPQRRGATALSPYIRHGLLDLPTVWDAVDGGPARDVRKFRDELLWQEYARHLYARLGPATAAPLRMRRTAPTDAATDPWPSAMACVAATVGELEADGWLVNQTRMWLASQWSVRAGAGWGDGEHRFFTHLLDGSRAANRLGWQWAVGTATGRPYGFSRWQVGKRAPGLCASCDLRQRCPIERWPDAGGLERVEPDPRLRHDPDPLATGGPEVVEGPGGAEVVWVTAESLGDADPALAAHPDLPVVWCFDAGLLRRLGLQAKRLVFLTECIADLATRRQVEVHVGDPVEAIGGRAVAATFTPVPGWRRLRRGIRVASTHPWPWLRRPGPGSLSSFSAWAGSGASSPRRGARGGGRASR